MLIFIILVCCVFFINYRVPQAHACLEELFHTTLETDGDVGEKRSDTTLREKQKPSLQEEEEFISSKDIAKGAEKQIFGGKIL